MVELVVLNLNMEDYLPAVDGIDFGRRRCTINLRRLCGFAGGRRIGQGRVINIGYTYLL